MKPRYLALAMLMAFSSVSFANETSSAIDFKNEIIPVLTRNGCNAGACHGAAIGRGGFKLSLYGGDPVADYEAIVRQFKGRRINLVSPDQSLIALKPAEQVEHGGGHVIDYDGESARLLIDWISQGAGIKSHRDLERVEITPRRYVAKSLSESVVLKAEAFYSDGTSRDVRAWTIFKAEDSSAVKITMEPVSAAAQGAQPTANTLRRGRHIVVARFLSEVVPIELIVPLTDSKVNLDDEPRSSFIDEEILQSLASLGLPPSPIIDEATFLRRISLDLTGRLPAAVRVLADVQESTDQRTMDRQAIVDKILESEEFTEYWTLQLAKLLRIRPEKESKQAAYTYHRWLAEQIANNVSYQQIARQLLLASGDSHTYGPANFYRTVANAREQTEFATELFMGSRLRCANCHNHPLDRWTQDDFHGLAAIFAKVESGRIVEEKPRGEVIHPRTLEPAVPRIPGERFLAENVSNGREQFADWLTNTQNPYFAKAIVNRLWQRMMGRGLVEPVDDFRATNPATHSALLNTLAEDFVAHGFSLRHTLRVIAISQSYARGGATEQNKDDDRFYSHAARRALEPEVLADAISDVLGVAGDYGDEPVGTRAVSLMDPQTPSLTLDVLGRCGRQESCEDSAGTIGGLPQKLHLFNGNLLNARISVEGSRLSQMLAEGKQPLEIVNAFYLVALNRPPTHSERKHWQITMESADDKGKFLEDFVWGLMTCNEFVTNH